MPWMSPTVCAWLGLSPWLRCAGVALQTICATLTAAAFPMWPLLATMSTPRTRSSGAILSPAPNAASG